MAIDLEKVMANIRAPIPSPYRPPPTPQKSWRNLKAGQVIEFHNFGPVGLILACDSQGLLIDMGAGPQRWSDPDWKAHFSIVKKLSKKVLDTPSTP